MKKLLNLLLLLTIALLISQLTACGRDKKTQSQEKTLKNTLKSQKPAKSNILAQLPQSTFSFLLIDSSTQSFQDFAQTKLFQNTKFLEDFDKVIKSAKFSDQDSLNLLELISKLGNQSLFAGVKPENSLQNIFFAYGETSSKNLGALFTAKESSKFLPKLAAIKQAMLAHNLQVQEVATVHPQEKKRFQVSFNGQQRFTMAVNDYKLLISPDPDLATRFFTKLDSADFYDFNKHLAENLGNQIPSDAHLVAFTDTQKVLANSQSAFLQQQKNLLKLLPQQVIFTSSLSSNILENNLYSQLNQEAFPPELLKILKNFNSQVWSKFSSNSVINLSLSIDAVRALIQFLIKNVTDEKTKSNLINSTAFMSNFPYQSELGISLASFNTTGFPDLQIILPLVNPAEKLKTVKQMVINETNTRGMGGMTWQSKQLGDKSSVPVDYIVTPFGIGLYLAHTNQELLITSSETAMNNLLVNQAPFQAPDQVKFTTGSPLYNFYLDYTKLYRVAMNVRNMIAMFLPQSPEVEVFFKNLEKFKNYGAVYADNTYQDGVLAFRNYLYPIEKQTTANAQ